MVAQVRIGEYAGQVDQGSRGGVLRHADVTDGCGHGRRAVRPAAGEGRAAAGTDGGISRTGLDPVAEKLGLGNIGPAPALGNRRFCLTVCPAVTLNSEEIVIPAPGLQVAELRGFRSRILVPEPISSRVVKAGPSWKVNVPDAFVVTVAITDLC